MFCSRCGAQIGPDARVCPQCGQAQTPVFTNAPVWTAPVGVKRRQALDFRGMANGDGGSGQFRAGVAHFVLVNSVASIVTQGPLQTGFHLHCMKRLFNRRSDIGDLFKGFDFFLPAFVASLLIGIFVFAGTLLCIIPGLVVASMYKFTYLFILDKRMDFWPAMQASHEVVKNDYFGFTIFLIVMALINILGALCCIVGLLVTIPVSVAAITIAYQEIVGFDQRTVDSL